MVINGTWTPPYASSRYGSSEIRTIEIPNSFSLRSRIAARLRMISSLYTTPVGLLGLLMITAFVDGVTFSSNSESFGIKVSVSGEITTTFPS